MKRCCVEQQPPIKQGEKDIVFCSLLVSTNVLICNVVGEM